MTSSSRVSPGAGTKTKRIFPARRFLSTPTRASTLASSRALDVDRQADRGQHAARALDERRGRDAARGAERQRGDHAQRHRLAVQQVVARRRLERVADGVAEVQDRAPAALVLVLGDDLRLHAHRARDQLQVARGGVGRLAGAARPASIAVSSDASAMKPHLMTSARPAMRSRAGSVSRNAEVGDHRLRLVERADQVLARRAGRRRSCRRPTRRPSPAAWSGTPRRRRRAGRSPRRTRRGRWWRRRRYRRPRRGDRSPPPPATRWCRSISSMVLQASPAGRLRRATRGTRRAIAATSGSTRGERLARSPSTSTATPVVDGPSAATSASAAASASIAPMRTS